LVITGQQGGAEQLLGKGDMLYISPGTSIPLRVHGAFVGDDEVKRVADDWRQRGKADYLDEVTKEERSVSGMPGIVSDSEDGEKDELYDEAVAFVAQSRRASISAVQRRLRVGYNRAARWSRTTFRKRGHVIYISWDFYTIKGSWGLCRG
jgi:S-DNA-T family DNA segregation ATPase FtsK/SpoIIIE